MSEEKASFERVKNAALHLRRQGIKATADRVIELTGGSKTTVLSHLKSLRENPADESDLPQHVLELARATLTEVYAAGRKVGEDRQRALAERASIVLSEQEAQIDELVAENCALSGRIEDLLSQLSDAKEARTACQEELDKSRAKGAELEAALFADREKSTMALTDAMSKLDALLALSDFQTMMPSLPARKGRSAVNGQGPDNE